MSTELSVKEQVAQEVARQIAEFEKKQKQREENSVVIGARVVLKEEKEGSPIVDKETKMQKLDANNVPMCYPTKYFVTIQFIGGSLVLELSSKLFDTVQETFVYSCEGRMGLVKNFGTEVMTPIITNFIKL